MKLKTPFRLIWIYFSVYVGQTHSDKTRFLVKNQEHFIQLKRPRLKEWFEKLRKGFIHAEIILSSGYNYLVQNFSQLEMWAFYIKLKVNINVLTL